MKKSLTVLAVALLHIPISCIVDDGGCGSFDSTGRYATIEADIGTYDDLTGFQTWGGTSARSWEELYLRIFPDRIEYLSLERKFEFSLLSSAYACSPPPPDFPAIDELSIVTDSAFEYNGISVSAGDTVSQLFRVKNHSNLSLDWYINEQNNATWIFGDFDTELVLGLTNEPTDTLNTSFTVIITLDDGTTRQTQTPVFKVY